MVGWFGRLKAFYASAMWRKFWWNVCVSCACELECVYLKPFVDWFQSIQFDKIHFCNAPEFFIAVLSRNYGSAQSFLFPCSAWKLWQTLLFINTSLYMLQTCCSISIAESANVVDERFHFHQSYARTYRHIEWRNGQTMWEMTKM